MCTEKAEGCNVSEISSAHKITVHKEKLGAYLRNEQVLPASLELDLSTECNRKCPLCPSTTSPHSSNLDLDFVEQLFARLKGQTKGLLLSGGEPTLAPIFAEVLRLARQYGFIDIAIVTNGSFLNVEEVASALCTYATTIRVSMYDWSIESSKDLQATLNQIKSLRERIEDDKSTLHIGTSVLTSKENAKAIPSIVKKVASAGAHWIYFHPMCIRWDTGAPERVNQSGVLSTIRNSQQQQPEGFRVYTFPERYIEHEINFSAYHGSHFLLVVGADGINYLGAEVKYQPNYIIADLNNNFEKDFLWQTKRLQLIEAVNSQNYPAVASRHRGVLYSHVIQDLINNGKQSFDKEPSAPKATFAYPHIL